MTRLFLTLTLAEASAILSRRDIDIDARVRGLAKIRTALKHATTEAPSPQPSAFSRPPLRAKHYRPRDSSQHFRMAKAAQPRSAPPVMPVPEPDVDNYVPWRDEAGGIWK